MNIRIQNQPGESLEDHLDISDVKSNKILLNLLNILPITLDISASDGFYLRVEEFLRELPEVLFAAPHEKRAFSIYPVGGVINAISIHYPFEQSRYSTDISTQSFRVIDLFEHKVSPSHSPDYFDRLIVFYHKKLLPHEVKTLLLATE